MKREFYLELWLGALAFGGLFVLLILAWLGFAFIAGYILQMNEPLVIRLVMGGFALLLLVPISYGLWSSRKLCQSRWKYRKDFIPNDSDLISPAELTAKVTFFGRWPQVGAYHECVLAFPSGKESLKLTPKFVSARAFDAIATTATAGQVKWKGEVLWRNGAPYLFRDESFRLWF